MTMICPDCGNMIAYNSYFSAFYCPRCGGIFKKVKPMTNADRIRAMSDEELSGIIRVIYMSEECPLGTLACETCFFKEVCAGEYCGKEVEWIQQPAEGE